MVHLDNVSAWQLIRSILETDRVIVILDVELVISGYTTHLLFEASDVLSVILDLDAVLLQLADK